MPRLDHPHGAAAPVPTATCLSGMTQVPGFGVRCRTGQKSYVLQYRVIGGRGSRQRRVTLGRVGALSLDDARVLAQEYLRGVRYGQDPAGDTPGHAAGANGAGPRRALPAGACGRQEKAAVQRTDGSRQCALARYPAPRYTAT